jgi:LPXTG-motif cell wall-anchored protein
MKKICSKLIAILLLLTILPTAAFAEDEATLAPEKPSSQPKVIVSNYEINPSPVIAGKEFTAKVTLKNTNEKKAVQNMTVTISCESVNLTRLNDSDTIFINKLGKGATTEIELKYKTDLETPATKYSIALAISYDNTDATALTSAGILEVSIQQALNVKMEVPQIAAEVNAGDTMPLSVQVMNLGRSMVYNVRVELSAPGLLPSGTAFVGNMEAGTAAEGKMDVFVGTKDMSEGYEGSDKYGFTSGTLTLIYEDANGQGFTDSMDISTTINEPVINTANTEPEEKPETASQWWISIAIGVVVLGALAAFLFIRRKNKGK